MIEETEHFCGVTLVRPDDPDIPLAKYFHFDELGELKADPYPKVKWFTWWQEPVSNIHELHSLVLRYYRDRGVSMLFGVPAEGIPNPTVRTKEAFPEPAQGRNVIAFDIDGLVLPDGMNPCSFEALEYARGKLPAVFQNVSFVAEWSNSAGVRRPDGSYYKHGANLHVFFFTDTPVDARLMEFFIEGHCYDIGLYALTDEEGFISIKIPLDLAVFRSPNQLLYTAEPMIDEGVACEIRPEERIVFVPGEVDSVMIPSLPADFDRVVRATRQRLRGEEAEARGYVKQRKIANCSGKRHFYESLQPGDPSTVRMGRQLLEMRESGDDGGIRVLYMEGEKSPGSWYVTKFKPWLARRYGDGLEVPLSELCPDAVEELKQLGWIDSIREAKPEEVQAPHIQFPGFNVGEDGVTHFGTDKKGNLVPIWLASPMVVDALIRDLSSEQWSYLLKTWDPDGRCHTVRLAATDLTSENFRRTLMEHGVRSNTSLKGRELLSRFIQEFPVEDRRILVESSGWLNEDCVIFALPDAVFGDAGDANADGYHMAERLAEYTRAYGQAGTLEEWQNHVAAFCRGNHLLVLASSAAFVPPLLRLTGMDNIGVHFRGPSSTGKTKLLKVAASVWGDPRHYINSWRTTDNALETLAAARNDALLTMDELGSLLPSSAGDATYLLGNGQGKGRMRADASARPVTKFRLVFLSSGEISLNQLLGQANQRSMAGHEVRFLDLKADAGAGMGIIQSLHCFGSSKEMVDHLDAASHRFYGTPIRAFLTRLLATPEDKDRTVAIFEDRIRALQEQWRVQDGDNQVHRVCERFAAVAAAGELAIAWGILPFQEGDATVAAHWCFQAWLEERGGLESMDVIRASEALVQNLHLYGSARFEWESRSAQVGLEGSRVPNPYWGYGKWINASETNPQFEFWIPVPTFEAEFCRGVTKQQLAEYLVARGFMEKPMAVTKRIPNTGSVRVYAIKGAILSGEVPTQQSGEAVLEMAGASSGRDGR